VGAFNLRQNVISNAPNFKTMDELVTTEFLHITWAPCGAHCLDFMIKDKVKIPWVKQVIDVDKMVKT
jgi:hypothetical protein